MLLEGVIMLWACLSLLVMLAVIGLVAALVVASMTASRSAREGTDEPHRRS